MALLFQSTRGPSMMHVGITALGLLTITAQLGGCASHIAITRASPKPTLLLHKLGNISDAAIAREKADRHLLRYVPATYRARLAVLIRIIAGYGQAPKIKIYALNQLMAADQSLAIGVLTRQIPRFQHWRVLIHACLLARATGDTALIDPLILSLNRPARRYPLLRRPEAEAIRALAHSSLRHCLAEKLLSSHIMAVRLGALRLLHRLLTRSQFYALLLADRHRRDPMLAALRWYERKFDYIPRSPDQVVWIQEFYDGPYSALARTAEHDLRLLPTNPIQKPMPTLHGQYEHRTASPTGPGTDLFPAANSPVNNFSRTCMPQGISPRLIGLLAALTGPHAYVPPEILRENIQRLYATYRHIRRPGPYRGSPDNPNPSLADNSRKLSYCDLLTLQTLYAALGHRNFRVQVTHWGDQSRFNTKAEEGGLIQLLKHHRPNSIGQAPALGLKLYATFKQINNGVYVTGPDLLLNTPAGLAQFVFHFQKSDNRRYTGPAPGDLEYVRTARCVVVIFTSTSRDTFDTTADFPDGAVIDLGIFKKCHRC